MRMDHSSRLMLLGRNVPQFLDSKTENLRSALLAKPEHFGQPLGQMPTRALGKEGVAGVQFHARLVVGPVAAVASNAHVAGRDALHRTVVVVEDLGGWESGENLDPELLRLPRQPTAQIAEAKRVGALVVHEGRHHNSGIAELALLRQHPMVVLGDRHGQRRAPVLPVGNQLVQRLGIDHRARKDVSADLAALFEDADRKFPPGLGGQLLEADCALSPAGPPPTMTTSYCMDSRSLIVLSSRPPPQFDSSALPIP